MAYFVAQDIVRNMIQRKRRMHEAEILVMGFTFKENCPDLRNTKVADLVRELMELAAEVKVYDPLADPDEAKHEYGIHLQNELPNQTFDTVVLAVRHDAITDCIGDRLNSLLKPGGLIYDMKGVMPKAGEHARI
jgi:UDP-N-acetyl-D-glucosamine/UDP-N-acetyl-D-galactosamine dehydrogenase